MQIKKLHKITNQQKPNNMKTKTTLLTITLAFLFGLSNNISAQTPYLVKDIRTGSSNSTPFSLININGTLFFSAYDNTNGRELWKSDGTDAGTVLVKDIYIGTNNSMVNSASASDYMANMNGILYFAATDAVSGTELWRSDGTDAGTVMVKDINVGTLSSSPQNIININGVLFFEATDGINGKELWKSDGTEAGTIMVKDINLGSAGSFSFSAYNNGYLTDVNGILYFQADNGTNGVELWKSDGTDAGTAMVADIQVGSGSSYPIYLTVVNGTLFFNACIVSNVNKELFQSDGTSAGTVLVKDIFTGNGSSDPRNLTNVNGTLFFSADNGTSGVGSELWKSDGTDAGTVLVKDINLGTAGSSLSSFINMNGTLFFSATNGTSSPYNGQELWKSDGTSAGTVMVKDIIPGTGSSSPDYLTNVNGTIYFAAGGSTPVLWKTDGTDAGTVSLSASYPLYLTNVNGVLFFQAYNSAFGNELWALNLTSTSIEEGNYPGFITLYPNPTTGKFTVIAGEEIQFQLEIYNTLGEKVFQTSNQQLNNSTIDISNQPEGIYFVKIYDGDKIYSNKIVVQ